MTVHKYRFQRQEPLDQASLRNEAGPTTTLVDSDGGHIQDVEQDDAGDLLADLTDALDLRGYALIATDPTTNPAADFSPSSIAGGVTSAIYRFSTTTTAADPGTGRARLNNATMSLVTEAYLDDFADIPTFDMGLIFNLLSAGGRLLIQQNDDSTRSGLFTVDSIVDNTGWWTFELTYIGDGGGGMVQDNKSTTFAFGNAAVGSGLPLLPFKASNLIQATTADWAVGGDDFAPLVQDGVNTGVSHCLFDSTTEEGVGQYIDVPATGAGRMQWTTRVRALAGPAGAAVAKYRAYFRELPDNAAVTAWGTAVDLTDVDVPSGNVFYQVDVTDETLATWGVTVGKRYQFEITRNAAHIDDDLVGDAGLEQLVVGFTA